MKPASFSIFLTGIILLTLFGVTHSFGADFILPNKQNNRLEYSVGKFSDPLKCDVRLSGTIETNDFEKFMSIFDDEDNTVGYYSTLCLNSTGGNFVEGMKIAKFLREAYITTLLEPDTVCFSACALIFMGGADRGSDFLGSNRFMHVTAKLGFHAPYLNFGNLKIDAGEAAEIYRYALQSVNSIVDAFLVPEYSRFEIDKKFWIKPSLIRFLTGIGKDELFFIDTIGKAGNYDISLFGYGDIALPAKEIVLHTCANLFNWRRDIVSESEDFKDNSDFIVKKNRADIPNSVIQFLSELNGSGWIDEDEPVFEEIYSMALNEGGSGGPECEVFLNKEGFPHNCGVFVREEFFLDQTNFYTEQINLCPRDWMVLGGSTKLSTIAEE